MALAILWAPSVKNGVSMQKARSFENRGQNVRKNGGRVQRELACFFSFL